MADPRRPALLTAAALAVCAALPMGAQAADTDFVTFRNEVTVERPVDQVWQRVGGWCAIAEWLKVTCDVAAGSGDVGSVRKLNGVTQEAMVAKGEHSYTYWQTVGAMAGLGYHGTLAATAIGPRRTRLTYTIVYDQAAMPSDAVRASEHTRLATRFVGPLNVMKQLSESSR